jgi:hypothetical protein
MYVFFRVLPTATRIAPHSRSVAIAFLLFCVCSCVVTTAQDAGDEQTAPAAQTDYVPAIQVLPDSVAGLVRVPNMPKFCEAWKKTHAGRLWQEESMQPFLEAQKARAKSYFESIDNKIGVRAEDLLEIASGEVVVSWLPFDKDKRRPFAICVIADVRGLHGKAQDSLEKIDTDLKAGSWTRSDVTHRNQTVRVYNSKPKPGQLKIEQIALTLNESQLIASDRDTVVTDLLDAVAGEPKGQAIQSHADFKHVLTHSARAIKSPLQDNGGTPAAEWYARPFPMGRIIRESLEVDRGDQFDILNLLENQGFNAIKAAGGIFAIAGDKYDLLHRGTVLAPPPFEQGSSILQAFKNTPFAAIPTWLHDDTASVNRIVVDIEKAFWASETIINEAFGDEIFRDIIDGIRDDKDGPQIDIAKNVLPHLDDEVILMTDNTTPADINCERMLVAIRVSDANAIKLAVQKAMEVEPDASKMDVLPGIDIWRVQRGKDDDTFDKETFGDLELGFEDQEKEKEQTKPPLLDHWAITVVDKGPGSTHPYLMFSSHPDLLVMTAKRIQEGELGGFGSLEPISKVTQSLKDLGCEKPMFDRAVRTKLSLRAKYQLLREGKLKDSDSVLASLARRMFEDEDGGQPDPLNAAKLPPLEQIEQFLPDGGSYIESTADGWFMTGFLLK